MTTTTLLLGVLFGSIGVGFLIYGRRQRALVPLISGLALIVLPYLVDGTALLLAIGVCLVAIPYFVRF
ncbi:MAG: hypothetical protein ABW187_04235 [Dokdonella sp.]